MGSKMGHRFFDTPPMAQWGWIWAGCVTALARGLGEVTQWQFPGPNLELPFLVPCTLALRALGCHCQKPTALQETPPGQSQSPLGGKGAQLSPPFQLDPLRCWAMRGFFLDHPDQSSCQLETTKWPSQCHVEQKNCQETPAQTSDSQNHEI